MRAHKPSSGISYTPLLIACGLGIAWALFWSVDTMLAYVLFGGTAFFLVLFFYQIALQRDKEEGIFGQKEQRRNPAFGEAASPSSNRSAPRSSSADKSPKVNGNILVAVAVVIGLFFLFYKLDHLFEEEAVADNIQYYDQAEQFYAAGQYDSAYYYYRAALALDAQMQEALVGMGNTLYMQSQIDSARWYYERALAINPMYTQARYNVGWWYYDQKQFRQSITELKVLVEQDPAQLGAMQLVGDNFYALNEYDSALRWYEGAYTNGSRSRWLCHVMAYIYDTKNQVDQAIPLYKEAIQYDSTLVDLYVRLGELLPNEEGEVYRFKAAQLKLSQEN